mgnify:CR=1 FL=1
MTEQEISAALPTQAVGRVKTITLKDRTVTLVVDASGLSRPEAEALEAAIRARIERLEGIDTARIALMADKVTRRIIAVGSGKGGVGKSTLTANLAVALARMGRKVGVVDADVYGPSQPMLLDAENQRPQAREQTLLPVETEFGIKLLSMGQLVEPGRAIAWRGPMVGSALGQMMDADWGDTDAPATLTVVREATPDRYEVLANVATQKSARTMALDESSGRVYLSAAELGPRRAPTQAEPHPRPTVKPGSFAILVVGAGPHH